MLIRDHPQRSIKALPSIYLRAQWFDSGKGRFAFMPHWRLLLEYWRAVRRSPLTGVTRLRARVCVGRSVFACWTWARLLMDFLVAIEPRTWVVHHNAQQWYRAVRNWLRPPALPHGHGKGSQ